jgi:hypothetical protein
MVTTLCATNTLIGRSPFLQFMWMTLSSQFEGVSVKEFQVKDLGNLK